MATRKPLIVNPGAEQIQELPSGDSLDGITNVTASGTVQAEQITSTDDINATGTVTAADFAGKGTIPLGGIIMWGGGNTVPTGFTLCNATNAGTVNGITVPNLEDKFIIGAKQHSTSWKTNVTGSLTATGGSKDAILVQHSHNITDNGHTHKGRGLGLNSIFGGVGVTLGSGQGYQVGYRNANDPANDYFAGANSTDTTGITVNQSTGSAATNNRLPPYFALAYIIRTS